MRQVVEINASPDTEYASDLVLTIPETDGSNGTLKVAMECAYAPYNWTQTTDANGAVPIANAGSALYANGYDVIFAKYIAASLGMNLEVYSYEWDSLIAAVQSPQRKERNRSISQTATTTPTSLSSTKSNLRK